uniref:Uncharacterized protein n=1 Tax=Anguilla anguilla TaxID=7936 RepID=A0A0E9QIF5_ANGAN
MYLLKTNCMHFSHESLSHIRSNGTL